MRRLTLSCLAIAIAAIAGPTNARADGAVTEPISYAYQGATCCQLYSGNEDGAGLTQVWDDTTVAPASQALSPDGQEIAFTEWGGDIYTDKLPTGRPVKIYDPTSNNTWGVHWSADGTRLIFRDDYDIRTINVDGTNLQTVIGWRGSQLAADFSPDGSKIVFSSATDAKGKALPGDALFISGVDGTSPRQITLDPNVVTHADDPVWSPDGTRIAFTCGLTSRVYGTPEICVVNADGTHFQRVTFTVGGGQEPSWSPDGYRLLYMRSIQGSPAIWDVARHDLRTGEDIDIVLGTLGQWGRTPRTATYRRAGGPLGLSDVLAIGFRPILNFDSGERWRPLDVERFMQEHDSAGQPVHQVCDDVGGCIPLSSPADLLFRYGPNAHIDIGGGGDPSQFATPGCSGPVLDCDPSTQRIYYHIAGPSPGGYTYLDYWFFYRYNQAPGDVGDHEGDWEGLTVAASTTAANTFDFVLFRQHDGGPWSYLRGSLSCDGHPQAGTCNPGVRVMAYIAAGTHATYAAPCDNFIAPCTQTNSPTPESDHDGAVPWGANNSNNDDSRLLSRLPAITPDGTDWAAGAHTWVDWPGRWGATLGGGFAESDSPAGPAAGSHRTNYETPWSESTCADTGCITASRLTRIAATCRNWAGPGIAVAACDDRRLSRATKRARVGMRGDLRVRVPGRHRRTARGNGITQAVGHPLRVGRRIIVVGHQGERLTVAVRIRRGRDSRVLVRRIRLDSRGRAAMKVIRRAQSGSKRSGYALGRL